MTRPGLPENLERVLSSKNLIENLFSRVREIGRRVKHGQSGTMVLRWTAPARSRPSAASASSRLIVRCRPWSAGGAPAILSVIAPARRLTPRTRPLN